MSSLIPNEDGLIGPSGSTSDRDADADCAPTVGAVLAQGAAELRSAGIETARLDAAVLLGCAAEIDRKDIICDPDHVIPPGRLSLYGEFLARRGGGEPTAYITGKKEFWSMQFKVGPGVLIPRPETEILVAEAIRLVREGPESPRGLQCLEIGTGSGAIAVALAGEIRQTKIIGIDSSRTALGYARQNARIHNVADRIAFICADLVGSFAPNTKHFDLIVSNPPYIESARLPTLQREIVDHEPRAALDGGPDGLDFYRKIVSTSPGLIRPGGLLCLEIGAGQAKDVTAMLKARALFDRIEVTNDYSSMPRVVTARMKRLEA